MEERNHGSGEPLELTPEMELDESDEPIIELTEVVETAAEDRESKVETETTGGDDNVIELEDVVEDDEPVIELTEVVDAAAESQDDEIIELNEVVEKEEAVVELTEVVEEDQPEQPAGNIHEPAEKVIELTETFESEAKSASLPEEGAESGQAMPEQQAEWQETAGSQPIPEEQPREEVSGDTAAGTAADEPVPVTEGPGGDLLLEDEPAEDGAGDLTDKETDGTVESEAVQEAAVTGLQPDTEDTEEPAQSQVIDLAPKLEPSPDTQAPEEDIKIGIEPELEAQPEENIFDDIAENLGLELEEEPEGQPLSADDGEIEAGLIRIVLILKADVTGRHPPRIYADSHEQGLITGFLPFFV